MNCSTLLKITAAALCLPAAIAIAEDKATQPNIIVFLVDDMGWQDTSVPFLYGPDGQPEPTFLNKRYRTPHMETLASQGMVLTNAYAHPVCSPSRVSLMTGMNAARHRVTSWTLKNDTSTDGRSADVIPPQWNVNSLQPEGTRPSGRTKRPLTGEEFSFRMAKPYLAATTLPALLRKNGYVTVHCGKAHFGTRDTPGANPALLGFDYNIAGTEIGGPADYRGSKRYGQGDFQVKGLDENGYYEDDVFLTEALTREAIKRLDAIRRTPGEADRPFYLYMSHYAIHSPFDQRGYDKRFADSYADPKDGRPWSDNERRYAGLIEGMDKSLGDLMAYLEAHGLDENTVILFMSDNGGLAISGRMGNELSNYPLSFGKGSGREGGIREPMIVRWPGVVKPGSACHVPVIIEDFFPSVLQMAGVRSYRTVQPVDGKSFVPLLKGAGLPERALLFHLPNIWGEGNGKADRYAPCTVLRQGDWKLLYWHIDQEFELFNLAADIGERENLAASQPEKVREMARVMTRLLRERRAQMPVYREGNRGGFEAGSEVPMPDAVAGKGH